MVTKFNPLFNGEQAFLSGQQMVAKNHKDNFDEILDVYFVPTEKEAGSVKPDMDRAIEKGAKVIQEHSMEIQNKEKNSFIDDSYLLVGKARFYKREFLSALETFNYIIQHYGEEKLADEARVWAAKCLIETENYLSAQANVEKLYRNKKTKKRIEVEALSVFAQIEIEQKNYEGAIQLLMQAIDKTGEKKEEIRWLFIIGQLHAKLGNHLEASEKFKEVIKKGPPYELLFQAQLNRARNYDVDLQNPNRVFDELRAMLRDDKNYDNRDQIYYVMAEVSERLGEDARVEEFLGKSIRISTVNDWQKGLSYLKFGEINFDNRLYPIAAAYYDSSFAVLPKDHKRYEEVRLKKESLGALVKNIQTIETQDSLQRIANLTEKQRLAFIEDLIKELKRKDQEAKEAEERGGGDMLSLGNTGGNAGDNTTNLGTFYFYNQNLRSVGVRDFRNRFGNRELEDNWRRADKKTDGSFAQKPTAQGSEDAQGAGEGGTAEGDEKYSVAQFLEPLPLTEEKMEASHQMIIDAFLAIGTIYKEELKDYRAAAKELEALLKRYPDLDIKGRVWYTLYRVYTLAEDQVEANKYKALILSELPDSEFASLILNEGKPKKEVDKSAAKLLYVEALTAYDSLLYPLALSLSTKGVEAYGSTEYGARFYLLRAYSMAQTPEKDKLSLALRAVVDLYPGTEEAEAANKVLAQMSEPVVDNKAAGAQGGGEQKSLYSYDAAAPHRYVLVVPNEGVDINNLRNDVSDFSTKFFKLENLSSRTIFLDKNNQIIIVNTFSNAAKALNYYNTLLNQSILVPHMPVQSARHFVISNDNFQTFYRDKDVEAYLTFFNEQYLKAKK
jgi:tetratricopeptide (TPR) repeat protein